MNEIMAGYFPRIHTAIAEWLSCLIVILPISAQAEKPRRLLFAPLFLFTLLITFHVMEIERVQGVWWTVMMGVAMWFVQTSGDDPDRIKKATRIYVLQLIVNFFWSIIFFGAEAYLFAFFWLLLLWVLILVTMVRFYDLRQTAGELMLPYFLWVTFAGYLNFGVYLLN